MVAGDPVTDGGEVEDGIPWTSSTVGWAVLMTVSLVVLIREWVVSVDA